ncbi:hypothetical protein [Ruminococcus sp.]|uniref:hypothetical protein n=1 Tax=Ruminococcus sp. TaxID=41978 RepID=UPI001B7B16DA|nr:hypothetical protein [Ruminococcus sp.]MBP5434007.1 hypothetical protein [Ruminococcus sp.]
MKKKAISFLTAFLTAISCTATMLPTITGTAIAASTSNVKFDEDEFYVAVGTCKGATQLRYFAQKSDGSYTVEKVVWEDAPADISYGDVFIGDGNIEMTKVMAAPDSPVYAMAYYYQLDDGAKLNKVGKCDDFMEKKVLTVSSKTYDGSAHWSIRYKDSGGKEYYYGLSNFASTLTVDPLDCEVGDVYTYALCNDYMVIPLAKENDISDVYAEPEYKIVKLPDKVEYKLGEQIDLKGIEIEVTKDKKEPVVYTYPDVAFDYQSNIPKSPSVVLSTDFRNDKAGTYKVEVVGADNVSFDVEVVDDSTIKDLGVFEEGEKMTLDDVIALSQKGNALTLNDFAKFKGVIAGSGIFILEYDLGKGYTLMVGSVALDKIDYARLRYTGSEKYIDIRTDDVEAFIAEMNAENDPTVLKGTETLTLDIVKELSKKGSALDWKDFEDYKGRDIGSGLYIWEFELEDGFKLLVGGVTGRTPDYIVLMRGDEKTIDIRTDDVEEFIETAPKKISYRIVKAPDKVVYRTGERIDLTGIQVEVTVGSGEPVIYTYPDVAFDYQSDIPKSPSVVLSTNFRSDIAGTYKVKVVDADNVSFDVEVVNDEETSSSTAMVTVLEINNDIMLLKPAEGSGLMRSADRLTMGTQVLGSDITPAVGMKLKISYSDILETYPAMFGRIDKVAAVQDENGFIRGDANCDEQVDMADAVLIMQALANPDRYGRNGKDNRYITELGVLNGDMDGNGLTVGDAQAIQLKLLGLDKEDSQSITGSMIANKLFRYEKSTDFGVYAISTQRNGSYLCIEGDFDAPRDTGTWKVSENTVVMTGQFGTNRFRYEDGTLIYIAEGSDGFDIKPKDGEKFYSLFDNSGISFTQPKLSDIVTIKTDYNPAMSDWSGIGILLEFASPEYDISLEAADGHFVDWDIKAGSGPISNEGKSCDIGKNGYTFWASDNFGYPDGFETEITVYGTSGVRQVELGKIYISQVNGMAFVASLEKPVITDSLAVAGKKFVYEKEGTGSEFTITFNTDGTFEYYTGVFSSYIGGGTWKIIDDIVVMTENTSDKVNNLKIQGSDLAYIAEGSDNFYGVRVKDGEKFLLQSLT